MAVLAEIGFQVTPADWAAVCTYQVRPSPLMAEAHRRDVRGTVLAGVIAVAILAAFGYLSGKDPQHAMARAVYFAAIMVIIWVLYAWSTLSRRAFVARFERRFRRLVERGLMPDVPLTHFHVWLNEGGVEWALGDETATHPWAPGSRVEHTSDAVFVHVGDTFFRMPRRAAKTEEEWNLFVATAERLARVHATPPPAP